MEGTVEHRKRLEPPASIGEVRAGYAKCKKLIISDAADADIKLGTIRGDVYVAKGQLFVRAYAKEIK